MTSRRHVFVPVSTQGTDRTTPIAEVSVSAEVRHGNLYCRVLVMDPATGDLHQTTRCFSAGELEISNVHPSSLAKSVTVPVRVVLESAIAKAIQDTTQRKVPG